MNSAIFRKSSIEKLSSPEQLDRLVKVTSPMGWALLAGLLAVLAVILVWGLAGNVATTVSASGILMRRGGLLTVQHEASGIVREVLVRAGDEVRQGDLVARIDQSDLVNQIGEARAKLAELERSRGRDRSYSARDLELEGAYLKQQEATISAAIANDSGRAKFLKEQLDALEDLQAQGGVSRQQVADARNQYQDLQRSISESRNQLLQLQMKRLDASRSTEQEEGSSASKIEELTRTIGVLESQLALKSAIVSPYAGRVVEVMVNEGSFYRTGTNLVSLEPIGASSRELEAVVFVPSADCGNLKPGMEAQISPASVKKEEYGYLVARVTDVADYPSTSEGMLAVLGNETLVQSLLQKGPVFQVRVALIESPRTPSGKKWSSPAGPPFEIHSGTMCTGEIIEKRQHPISLVIPFLKKKLGV